MDRLRQLRLEAKLTQVELADFLGINQVTYSRYEKGARTLPYDLLIKIADYYGVSTDYLLGRTDTPYYTVEATASDGKPVRAYSTTNKAPLTAEEVAAVERIEADPEAAGVVKVPLSKLLEQDDLPESLRRILEGIAKEAAQKAVREELSKQTNPRDDGQ